MLAPLSWLKEYVDIDVPARELERLLFSVGFEVEELIELGKDISGVVVGEVKTCELIPDTHIHVCTVDCGDKGTFQICCGADNVCVGGRFPVALEGATVYATAKDHVTVEGVITIKKGKLRGVDSEGMLCSGVEIGVSEDMYDGGGYCGLLVLPEDAPLGADVKPIVGLDDYIFDIGITANRPDCQSIIGIAREVAAVLKKEFRMPALNYTENGKELDFSVTVEAPDLCPRYIGHYVSDITIGKSPAWMRRRLSMVGINSISNIVDITNYVLKEFGQPMHAFDLGDLQNSEIVVRRAHNGEKIVTLDEKEFELNENNLVICDGNRPVALAGIMGGLNSEIKDTTTDVIFESAKFARDNVRKTSRALGQSSDSSARFEKGVDEYSTQCGMKRALHLIEELGCGKVSSVHVECAVNGEVKSTPLTVSIEKMNGVLGIKVPDSEIICHLAALGFEPKINGDELSVMVPPYRDDIEGHVQDIAEEVIRSYGYDNIVPTFLSSADVTCGGLTPAQKTLNRVKKTLCTQGYSESMFYSFFSPKDLDMLRYAEDAKERHAIRIMNPISEDLSLMRTTLVPSMVNAAVRNLRRGNTSGRFFEVASIFEAKELPLKEYPREHKMLSIGAFGDGETFFTFKGAAEALAKEFGVSFTYEKDEVQYLHPGMTAKVLCGGEKVGFIGRLAHDICDELAIEKPVFVAEFDYEKLSDHFVTNIVYKPIPKFALETRDLALVMDESVTCGAVEDAIKSSCKYITSVTLFDVYHSAQIGEGKKSMAFKLVFTPDDHEFTGEEIDGYITRILKKLSYTMHIEIR
ncbi:MAG: phenylalanine--tRNA ligase subunit beta [Ruminococcaceae bacterium]|nr:phenylalanine--tRNA ligase subunit beta [Oscillospiraceae bacterium]